MRTMTNDRGGVRRSSGLGLVRGAGPGALVSAVGLAGLCLFPAHAIAAEPSPVTLAWHVPDDGASCPTREQMLGEIDRVLGPPQGPRTSVTAEGHVERGKRGTFRVRLTLVTEGKRAEREFGAASCVEAAGAAALIVALTVDASVRPPDTAPFTAPTPTAPAEPPPEPPVAPPPPKVAAQAAPPRPASAAPVRPAAPPPRRSTFAAGVAGSGAVESGVLPSATGGGQITAFAAASLLRTEAELSVFAPTEALVVEPAGRGGSFSALTFGGRVCALFTYGRLAAGPCGSALVVNVSATGLGAVETRTETVTWAGVGGDALVLVRLGGPVSLRARMGGAGMLDRPSFVLDAGGTRVAVHRPASSSFTGSIGVELHFF